MYGSDPVATQLVLSCNDLGRFSNSGSDTADPTDLASFSMGGHIPESAFMIGNELTLIFDAVYGTSPQDLMIAANAIYSSTDELNSSQTVMASNIIDYAMPIIYANIYREGSGDPLFAKLGDTVTVEFSTSETVTINSLKIAGHDILSYQTTGESSYSFSYVVQDGDSEGMKRYFVSVNDSADNTNSTAPEDGVTFDKTKPEVDLVASSVYDLEIHDEYVEEAVATDSLDGIVPVLRNGTLNTDIAGTYFLSYTAYDRAGNQADILMRTINVIDSVALDFDILSTHLRLQGIENNLDQVNTDNQTNFSNLYFEKYISGVKIARITFGSALDLSGSDTIDFLQDVGDLLLSDGIGMIDFDLGGITSSVSLYDKRATIQFFGINNLEYDRLSNAQDLYSRLSVFDNDGNRIDTTLLVTPYGFYNSINYTYTIDVAHFTKFVIANATPRSSLANDIGSDDIVYGRGSSDCYFGYFFHDIYYGSESNELLGSEYFWVNDDGINSMTSGTSVLDANLEFGQKGELGSGSEDSKNFTEQQFVRTNRQAWVWWLILFLMVVGWIVFTYRGRRRY